MPDADAMTERISQAVARVVRAVPLDPAPTAVAFRKRPQVIDADRLPLLMVCVGDAEEFEPLGAGSATDRAVRRWAVRRPLTLALAFKGEGKAADNPGIRAWRDALWGAVTQRTLERAGLPGANDVAPRGRPLFDPAAFASSTVDLSMIDLTIETIEDRRDA